MKDSTMLDSSDFARLIPGVFPFFAGDRTLGVLVDVPNNTEEDTPDWKNRRSMAQKWVSDLRAVVRDLKLEEVLLIAYPDVGSNNADLPDQVYVCETLPDTAEKLGKAGKPRTLSDIFAEVQLFLAPTEYSTTAPLKVAARKFGFRAATMPGFSKRMVPALKIDYNKVNIRVNLLKDILDKARGAHVEFSVLGDKDYSMRFDLRWRRAHASGGRFPVKGTAGNLPSGEAYIVPYEGENRDESFTAGILPVQISSEICLFRIERNRAVAVQGSGPSLKTERDRLYKDPAYGNMAELGFGVLESFGVKPVGSILLDEKLGFHVAFGRSDHFGGQVGPSQFSSPKSVIHLDRIYIPATQPGIRVRSVVLDLGGGRKKPLMENGRYLIFTDDPPES